MIFISLVFTSLLCAEDIVLKDGRVLSNAEIFSQSSLSVMVKHSGGLSSVPKTLLPDKLATQYPVPPKALEDAKAKEVSKAKIRESAVNGDPSAQFALGDMYFTGDGVSKDFGEATKWYRQAAEQGDERAQYKLARMYEQGEGVPRDFHEAAQWYRKAGEQGNADAQANLGLLYEKGTGVPQSSFEASKWMRKAAEQGNLPCQKKMISFYLVGEGVPRDVLEALAWVDVVAASGDYEAKKWRDRMEYEAMASNGTGYILLVQKRSSEIFKVIASNKVRKTSLTPKSTMAPPEAASAKSNGSGVIISTTGYVLTAAHVVAKSAKIVVVTAQGSRSAKVIRLDEANDVAVIKLEAGTYTALPVISSRQVRLGQTVATIGFPVVNIQGFSPKVTRGEISSMNGAGDDPRKWQISVPVQPGNSGGPLLDENGNVIGVVVSTLLRETVQNVNYATKGT